MLIIFIIFILIILAIVVLSSLWIIDTLLGEEDFLTSKEAIQRISQIIVEHNCQNGLLYDLGSCRGAFVFGILNVCPNLRVVGIDKSSLRTWFAKLLSLFHKNKNSPQFLKANIFETDVSRIDLAFVYLPRPLLPALEIKLQKELKPGALVITYRINLPNWQPIHVSLGDLSRDRNNIFIYQKP